MAEAQLTPYSINRLKEVLPSQISIGDQASQQLPSWRIVSIKMYSTMTLQYILQTYSCAYVSKREWVKVWNEDDKMYPIYGALLSWLLSIILTSILSIKLRSKPLVTIPLYVLYSASQTMLFVFIGVKLASENQAMLTSVMQMSICIALSLYSCCLKEQFTTLYSHIFAGIFLVCAMLTSIALFSQYYICFLCSAACVGLWASFVTHNLMAIHMSMGKNESFYLALLTQTDMTILINKCCKRRIKS